MSKLITKEQFYQVIRAAQAMIYYGDDEFDGARKSLLLFPEEFHVWVAEYLTEKGESDGDK